MKKRYSYYSFFISLLLFSVFPRALFAQLVTQGEKTNWYFGNQAGVKFISGVPIAQTNGVLTSYEGCASVSTPAGQLLMYSNGEQVWDAKHQLMPNGSGLGGHTSASQVAMMLKKPGSTTLYYIFVVDAIDNNLVGGLRYSIVDMSLRGGLGDVTATKAVRLPTPTQTGKVTEKLTAALHSNGRDYWIVVHGWQNNSFYSFLLSPSGVSTTPVTSNIGPTHQGGGSFFGAANAVGYMRISPDGSRLALAQRDTGFELYSFNKSTGTVFNYQPLTAYSGSSYGVEFSPDNSRLYCGAGTNRAIMQFNLLAGSTEAINSSLRTIAYTNAFTGALLRGPDDKIYVSVLNDQALHVINSPNALGSNCDYRQNAVPLLGRLAQNGLPNFPNAFIHPLPTVNFLAPAVCVGATTNFTASVTPNVPDAVITWNFGDTGAGSTNTGSGQTATHAYSKAGTYSVTLSVTLPDIQEPITVTQQVTVNSLPTVTIGPATQKLCQGSQLTLTTNAQPAGSTYRWQDGSAAASFVVKQAGTYSVAVTSLEGCSATTSVVVEVVPVPVVKLGADTVACLAKPVLLRTSAQPTGTTFRWQDGTTGSTLLVSVAGTYTVTATSPSGCSGQDEIVVREANCPFIIPNIITPNGDNQNDTFVLKGLTSEQWQVEIYNRWGRRIYQAKNYDNQWGATGEANGVYYYLLTHISGKQYRGWVEVVR
ncbi:gliding motility-associated C-terminal domain-containing protein [Hymenobacter sp. BT730]|uniref:T9SS type B sorting domain-containing protein n=1 Tax=Hymenobacter sp. BT730 TaxID=3063332 RepID=UPI0026E0DBBE|nr:gliding motility-associated C-terminal domain-containing protein [Hymenobacter sp. BT730]